MGNLLQSYRNGAFDVESDTFDEQTYDSATGHRGLGGGKRSVLRQKQEEGSGVLRKKADAQVTGFVAPADTPVASGLVNEMHAAFKKACVGFERFTDEVIAYFGLPETFDGLPIDSPEVARRIEDHVRANDERIFLAFSAANGG